MISVFHFEVTERIILFAEDQAKATAITASINSPETRTKHPHSLRDAVDPEIKHKQSDLRTHDFYKNAIDITSDRRYRPRRVKNSLTSNPMTTKVLTLDTILRSLTVKIPRW